MDIITIAEICCNHMGSMDLAKKMIDELAKSPKGKRVNVIKFQKRTPRLCMSEAQYNAPHPNPENAFGKTYGEHREFLEFNIEQHLELKKYLENKGFTYSCSVFDKHALEEILSINPHIIKVGSANNIDYDLLKIIDNNFQGSEIHISLGMTSKDEESKIIKSFKNNLDKLVLYACTSAYPTKPEDTCLCEITRLKNLYGKEIKAVGFSGHHLGVYLDVAALALGATYFERHYTLDRNLKGTDQKFSLEPPEFSELVSVLNETNKGLQYKNTDILPCEEGIRTRLKFKKED